MRTLTIILIMGTAWSGAVHAQNTSLNKNLKGTWSVDMENTVRNISGDEQVKYNKMTTGSRETIRKAFQGRTYSFANSQVTIDFVSGGSQQHVTGVWSYEPASRILRVTAEQRTKEYIVQWESADRISITDRDTATGNIIKQIHLIRQR